MPVTSSPTPALAAIGEIVHDVDLKDARFGREEAIGIAHLITGLSTTHKTDGRRIERGAAILAISMRTSAGSANPVAILMSLQGSCVEAGMAMAKRLN